MSMVFNRQLCISWADFPSHALAGMVLGLLLTSSFANAQDNQPAPQASSSVAPIEKQDDANALFDAISARAKALAQNEFKPFEGDLPEELEQMTYEEYRSIRFLPEASLWRGESLFEIQLFHPGFLYREPVKLNMAGLGADSALPFKQEFFSYDGQAKKLAGKAPANTGFAGFRVHYPLNTNEYKDEFLVFQGASYFRLVGPGQRYGLSGRGLAINTADSAGEEFPVFKEFWLVKPEPTATHFVIYALLDSPSISGAYRFNVVTGAPTEMTIDARLYARTDIKKLGIAPLTSMFHHGENSVRYVDDFRPEVHDSDGLLMAASNGEWIWRPLSNPHALHVSALTDDSPKGFGLLQRDRDFTNYLDMEADYQLRPGLWIEPLGQWGKGYVELVEIPTDTEANDNIVAYWVPEQPMKAGDTRQYTYRLRSVDQTIPEQSVARVLRTRIGWGAIPGHHNPPPRSKRQFVVDFQGGGLENLSADTPLEAELQKNSGTITDLMVTRLPDQKTWRASFKLEPDNKQTVDMRLFIKLRDQRLTEVWSYVWYPDAIQ